MATMLSGLALTAGVGLFVVLLRTHALGTAQRWIATVALATVALLAGIGLSLVSWPGTAGALLAVGLGTTVGARVAAAFTPPRPPTTEGPGAPGG